MKSEWKVASNYFGGDKPFYQVYRKIDVDAKIDHQKAAGRPVPRISEQ